MLLVTRDPIDMQALSVSVADPAAGAIVTFAGTTRNETGGREVESLCYEAYEEMAKAKLEEIGETARTRFDILKVAAVHRLGLNNVGEISVGIAVSAGHRPAAFDACRFVIDAIKRDVPIWKKERFADGEEIWVHPGGCC